jgi:predicted homoserine dehydrogenase-like protein
LPLYTKLSQLEDEGTPLKVGLIGAGTFGTQLLAQCAHMKGIRLNVVCDLDQERSYRTFAMSGVAREKVEVAEDVDALNGAIEKGVPCMTRSSSDLVHSKVDMIIEATGNVEAGATHAYQSLLNGKHVMMVTVEADVVIGPLLKKMADRAGLVYSLAYGDEPCLAYEIFERATALGLRVIAAGKGTRFIPEFRKSTPDVVFEKYGYTEKSDFKVNPKMFNSFLDGTKHSIEVTAISNMTGLLPDVRGLHFPGLDVREIPDTFSLKSKGGILDSEGVVEAVSSIKLDGSTIDRNLRGGVFCVVEAPSRFLREVMESYGLIIGIIQGTKTGQALLYRPQHLVGIEAPITLAKAAVYHEPTGAPAGWFSEVVTAAKKPLSAGTILDGEGGYTTYGLVEKATVAFDGHLLPFGLSHDATLTRDIPEDGVITYDDVKLRTGSIAANLRMLQDESIKPGVML